MIIRKDVNEVIMPQNEFSLKKIKTDKPGNSIQGL